MKLLLSSAALGRCGIDSTPIEPGKDYSLTPVLGAEMSKPPFDPKVAGRIAFFFGPIAGALVSVVSLRRAGYPLRSGKILRWTLLVSAVMALVLTLMPDGLGRLFGLAAEITFYTVYPRLQENEFEKWKGANPGLLPSSGWGAMGWGVLGMLLLFVVTIVVAIPLMILFPSLTCKRVLARSVSWESAVPPFRKARRMGQPAFRRNLDEGFRFGPQSGYDSRS